MAESTLSILFDLFAASQKARVLLTDAMAESPLSPTEYAIYSLVFDVERITPTDMAARMGLPITTLLDHLHEMEGRDHLSRSSNPADGRSYLVSLTPTGLAVHALAGKHFDRAIVQLLDQLAVDEATARRVLEAIGAAAEAALRNLGDSATRSSAN